MINWLTALKVLPWKDMIDYAPTVVSGAQKLWQRVKNQGEDAAVIIEQEPLRIDDPSHEIQELKQQLQDLSAQQLELSTLINELAAQNQRLVGAVDVLRARTRILLFLCIGLGVACAYLLIAKLT
ncbi:MAG TPA: hypothetical protein VGK97_11290 [Spongiibacteraceae bacterium]|jgi:hypothetical protein